MQTYQKLEADIATARKARDSKRLLVLTMLINKIQLVAKNDGNREVREDAEKNDVVMGVSRYRKEVDEMRLALDKAGRPTDEQDYETAVITAYLPQQMTAEALDAEIEKALEGTARTRKDMGTVMKHLNTFKGQFDPKAANAMVTAKLS